MDAESNAILKAARALSLAELQDEIENPSQEVQVLKLDLTVLRDENNPFDINFPFRTIFVRDATDTSTVINVRLGTKSTFQELVPFYKNDSAIQATAKKAYLSWPAQPGKSITLIFFARTEFRTGSLLSQNAGGFSINDGSSATLTNVTTVAAAAGLVVGADVGRKIALVQNQTGNDIYLGVDATVNATTNPGIKVEDGAQIAWRNTAALYAFAVASGKLAILAEK